MRKVSEYSQFKKKYTKPLQELETYLKKQDYEINTIRQFKNYTAYFFNWRDNNGLEQINYNDLLVYIVYCREQGNSTKLINRKLASIRKYYEHLQSNGEALNNPAAGLFLKGKRSSIPHNLLDKEELKQLYENYQAYDLRTARNKIILSLIIHQAISTKELHSIEPQSIKLKSGKIEIQGGKHSNGRTLELEANQIIELQEYLNETRPEILKAIKSNQSRPARKAENPDFKQAYLGMKG